MIVSYNLLREYIDLDGISLDELCNKMSLAGFEIEGYKKLAEASNLVIGYVVECEKHPDSDHLHVCQVDDGTSLRQIVCGAPNIQKGQKVIVSLPGAVLPAKGIEIKEGVIRGVKSQGMICSLMELGVDENKLSDEQKNSIEVLPDDAEIGNKEVLAYLQLDDVIIDISVTPNRSDVFGLYHLFKEIAAIVDRKMKKEDTLSLHRDGRSRYRCTSETRNCEYFSMTTVEGVVVKPSPKWLQDILNKHDIKVINNVVDIGNYVTLMTGQPLHMYDASKLKCDLFIVKDDLDTSVVALDEKTYQIQQQDLVVTNGKEVGCIAGVIGSQSTMIDENTHTLAVEAALFNGNAILNSCKKYGIMTVAATNYSKNAVDRYKVLEASDMACDLLIRYADAKKVSLPDEYDQRKLSEREIEIDTAYIAKRIGYPYSDDEIENVFRRLSMTYVKEKGYYRLSIPSYRNDLEIKEDIVEEVVRLTGFEKVPYRLSTVDAGQYGLNKKQKDKRMIMNYLLDLGLTNTLSYTLINEEDDRYYGASDNHTSIRLPHPLTVEKEYMRKNMIASMLKTVAYNQARGIKDIAVFEMSSVYCNENMEGNERLSIAISNSFHATRWLFNYQTDFYLIKGIMEGLLSLFGIDSNRYRFQLITKKYPDQQIFHPGKTAVLMINGKEIAILGEIHPSTLQKEGIDPTVYLEMDLDAFLAIKTGKSRYSSVSKFPPVSRDIAMVVKEEITADEILKTIKKAAGSALSQAEIFDVYQGEHVKKGYKSVAIRMTFVDYEKTLTDALINELFAKVYQACQKDFQAAIRN